MSNNKYTFASIQEAVEAFQDNDILPELLREIKRMPKGQQEILKMRLVQLKSSKEIAVYLNCSVSSVNSKIRQGLVHFRKQFYPEYYREAMLILYDGRVSNVKMQ